MKGKVMSTHYNKLPWKAEELKVQLALGSIRSKDIIRLLRSKRTTSEMLRIFYEHGIEDVSHFANHKNTPADILKDLYVKAELATCDDQTIPYYTSQLVQHPTLPMYLLRDALDIAMKSGPLANYYRSKIIDVFMSPRVPQRFLTGYVNHPNNYLRMCIARNQATPPYVLTALANGPSHSDSWHGSIRESVAENTKTPSETLHILGTTKTSAPIRRHIIANPSTTADTLKHILQNDKARSIRAEALSKLFERGKVIITD